MSHLHPRRRSMAKARRTTHRSKKGTKLYAVRDRKGRFKDIQTYERAHGADIRRRSKAEGATKTRKNAPRKKTRCPRTSSGEEPTVEALASPRPLASTSPGSPRVRPAARPLRGRGPRPHGRVEPGGRGLLEGCERRAVSPAPRPRQAVRERRGRCR